MEKMKIKRGDVFYVRKYPTVGSEQRAARPAIVVSNDYCNAKSEVVEVVYMTTQVKNPLPTHVAIKSTGRDSVALCEQITSVSISRLDSYLCHLTPDEMLLVDRALSISIGVSSGLAQPIYSCGADLNTEDEKRLLSMVCLRYVQSVLSEQIPRTAVPQKNDTEMNTIFKTVSKGQKEQS